MCSPLPPEVFGQPTAPISSSTSWATWATRRTASKRALGHRVEVDPPLVGPLDVGAPRVPRDGTRPSTSAPPRSRWRARSRTARRRAARTAGSRSRRSPPTVRRARREPLLVDLLAVDAVGEAVQHARPLAQRADDPVADAQVVAGEVELGLAARREVDPVGAARSGRSARRPRARLGSAVFIRKASQRRAP